MTSIFSLSSSPPLSSLSCCPLLCDVQLNNAVSGALDRLHYEKDPCVRYDGTRKVWIYLHRGRNEEDFGMPDQSCDPSCDQSHDHSNLFPERIHWACEVAAKQRKMLAARPKITPVSLTNSHWEVYALVFVYH